MWHNGRWSQSTDFFVLNCFSVLRCSCSRLKLDMGSSLAASVFFYFSKADCVSNWKFPDVCSTVQILWVHIIYFQNNFKVSVQFAQIIEFSKCVFVRRRKLDAVFFLSLFVQCSNFVLFKLDIWCLPISNFECWKFLLLLLFTIQTIAIERLYLRFHFLVICPFILYMYILFKRSQKVQTTHMCTHTHV